MFDSSLIRINMATSELVTISKDNGLMVNIWLKSKGNL
jgi:hypothetical protein